jgi:hypothetical protein
LLRTEGRLFNILSARSRSLSAGYHETLRVKELTTGMVLRKSPGKNNLIDVEEFRTFMRAIKPC